MRGNSIYQANMLINNILGFDNIRGEYSLLKIKIIGFIMKL